MPNKDKEGMDAKKVESFKTQLLKMKDDILRNIETMSQETGGQMADSKDVSGHVSHMADVATDMYDREFALGLVSNERELLQKIEAALKRIADGTYGVCLGTGKVIALARLKAIPYVEHCLEHQEKIEQER